MPCGDAPKNPPLTRSRHTDKLSTTLPSMQEGDARGASRRNTSCEAPRPERRARPDVGAVARRWATSPDRPTEKSPERSTPEQASPAARSRRSLKEPSRSNSRVKTRPNQRSPQTPSGKMCATPRPRAGIRRRRVEWEELQEGVTIQMGSSRFRIGSALGQGSFGVVWGASSANGDVAIKEIVCRSSEALADAEFEGQLLRTLGGVVDGHTRIPSLIAIDKNGSGSDWRVRLAMTQIPGEPLGKVLDGRRSATPKGCVEIRQAFADALDLAGELLRQLVPTFEHVAMFAFHRDVTPRNILICRDRGTRFGLIDFGLAVDSTFWRLGVSVVSPTQPNTATPGWQQVTVAGDGRYWPVCSWFVFGHGRRELGKHPGLCQEYKNSLDVHSLGLTALQVVAELTPPRSEESTEPLFVKLWQLRVAWQTYWKDATHFWLSIYQSFQKGGDFQALKAAYARAKVHEAICRDLLALRLAIHEAREACDGTMHASLARAPAFLDALLLMVGTGETEPVSWETIRELLESVCGHGLINSGKSLSTPTTSPDSQSRTTESPASSASTGA